MSLRSALDREVCPDHWLFVAALIALFVVTCGAIFAGWMALTADDQPLSVVHFDRSPVTPLSPLSRSKLYPPSPTERPFSFANPVKPEDVFVRRYPVAAYVSFTQDGGDVAVHFEDQANHVSSDLTLTCLDGVVSIKYPTPKEP